MPIPATKAKTNADLNKQLTLLFGAPKTGKSTLAAQFPDVCFLATEPGLNSLEAFRWEAADGRYVINSWAELMAATSEVVASGRFKTLVIDTLGNACALCDEHVSASHGEEYKLDGKLGYGKGAAMIVNELKRYLTKLGATGLGVILIAHTTTKTISTRTGTVEKIVPAIPGDNKAGDIYNLILGMCDLVLYLDQQDGKRVIRTKPHATYDAGDRSGRLPEMLDSSFQALNNSFRKESSVQSR
jgi:hypothetical protein